MNLLQIYYRVRWWKNFENRITVGEVMGKSLVSFFFDSWCSAFQFTFTREYTVQVHRFRCVITLMLMPLTNVIICVPACCSLNRCTEYLSSNSHFLLDIKTILHFHAWNVFLPVPVLLMRLKALFSSCPPICACMHAVVEVFSDHLAVKFWYYFFPASFKTVFSKQHRYWKFQQETTKEPYRPIYTWNSVNPVQVIL